jgi:hypothetical protein
LRYFNVNIFLRFVLLKEKNMLLTMEHESKNQTELFPNPERIDKVSNFTLFTGLGMPYTFWTYRAIINCLCGLVVRVPGYRSRGPGFNSWRYQIF